MRVGLGMSWPRTVRAAWLALRAIQLWAPLAGNDPERARRYCGVLPLSQRRARWPVFGVPESAVRPAAFHRCRAMKISDQWVTQGMRPDSPLLAWERTVLVRSYTALLAAIRH